METGGVMVSRHGLFTTLFDFSFTELATTKLAKGLYALAVGGAGLLGVVMVLYGMTRSLFVGILSFLLAALLLLFTTAVVRLSLEAAVVLMRIADQLEEIAEQVAGIAVQGTRLEGSTAAIGGKGLAQ